MSRPKAGKRIGLLRHADAEPKMARLDIDRALSQRGRTETETVAAWLAGQSERRFDVALVSPATRTRETWELAGCSDIPVQVERSIYDAPVETLLDLMTELDDAVSSVVVVGHNPGIEDLASLLVPPGSDGLPGSFPTAGLAVVSLPIASWRELSGATGRLEAFVAPG